MSIVHLVVINIRATNLATVATSAPIERYRNTSGNTALEPLWRAKTVGNPQDSIPSVLGSGNEQAQKLAPKTPATLRFQDLLAKR